MQITANIQFIYDYEKDAEGAWTSKKIGTLYFKGTKIMNLKEELKKLYKESEATKKREFLEKALPDRLRDAARKGCNCCTIPLAEIEYNFLSGTEIKEWCIANDLRLYTTDAPYGCYISIYWI